VHLISVSVTVVTTQATSSIKMVTSVAVVPKPVPVKVISSPPTTFPYLGEILWRSGVMEPSYVTAERSVVAPETWSLGVHENVVAESSMVSTP